jgi:hypothetical protein
MELSENRYIVLVFVISGIKTLGSAATVFPLKVVEFSLISSCCFAESGMAVINSRGELTVYDR